MTNAYIEEINGLLARVKEAERERDEYKLYANQKMQEAHEWQEHAKKLEAIIDDAIAYSAIYCDCACESKLEEAKAALK